MDTKIKYTDSYDQELTPKQVENADHYVVNYYEDDILKKAYVFKFNIKHGKVLQAGGTYYVSHDENLDNVIAECLSKAKSWLIYFNNQSSESNNLWHYIEYRTGVFNHKGIHVFDSDQRIIASCLKDTSLGILSSKWKFFYGDPLLFPVMIPGNYAMKFVYDNETNELIEVGCNYGIEHDNDYFIDAFLQQEDIMSIFPWDEHTYYHTFEPILV